LEGTQVGAYRLLRRIGEGGMGAVWLAEHAMLGRRAALKVLHPELSSRSEIVTRFFNEARAATAIADPGIVQIFDFGQHTDGSAYIVMELLDGEPLDRRLARHGALGLPDALRIMRQVASTLGAAHACGIVHRDLKPENVFIVRDPEVAGGERAKILDFGIAKLASEHGGIKTHTQAVMGTPAYMSPEQCRGAGRVDQRSDVYALGCMLFALLVGRPPFDAEGAGEIIAMHLREPPPAPSSLRPGIPAEVERLVLRCLAKDPAQRFTHGGELAGAIEGLLRSSSPEIGALGPSAGYAAASLPTTLSSAAGASSVARPARSGRVAALVGFGVVAAGGVIAIVVSRGGSDAASPEPGPASVPAPAPAPAPEAPSAAPPAVRPPDKPDPNVEVVARTKDVLRRFVAWSRDHQGAPCPELAALGDAPSDPWGHPFRLTCTDQPGDQIIGAISSGPDGVPGTADDIASWLLGREVTDSVRGARWIAAAAPSMPAKPEPGSKADPSGKPAVSTVKPAETKPANGAKPKQERRGDTIELDVFGLPKKR
jgi:tRNA A-37 threonylcarbamoyl transferase component Bud32